MMPQQGGAAEWEEGFIEEVNWLVVWNINFIFYFPQ